MVKGNYKEECYRTACSNKNALYFNHSTKKHYCSACAMDLNSDPFNKADAERLYGHALCTMVFEVGRKENKIFPNGFKSWQETHFEIAGTICHEHVRKIEGSKVAKIFDENGYSALYQFAEDLTEKFEEKFKGVKWGEDDKDFYEEIECFINCELELFESTSQPIPVKKKF